MTTKGKGRQPRERLTATNGREKRQFSTSQYTRIYPRLSILDRHLRRMQTAKNPADYLAAFSRFLNEIEVQRD